MAAWTECNYERGQLIELAFKTTENDCQVVFSQAPDAIKTVRVRVYGNVLQDASKVQKVKVMGILHP
jgi:hypothetical protein